MDANAFLKSISQQVAPEGGSSPGPNGVKLQFSIPCYEVEYEERKAPSFRSIFYDLPFPQLPQYVGFHVANGWIGGRPDSGLHQVIKMLKPDGSVHLETPRQPLQFRGEHVPFMAINRFPEIPFEVEGYYWIVVYLEEQEVLRYPLSSRVVGWEAYGEVAGEMKARYEAEMAERAARAAEAQRQHEQHLPQQPPNPFNLGQ